MNDIVIPEITIGFWELPTAALIMMAFLISGMAVSNNRKWLKTTLWRAEAIYWVLGIISISLFLPAIWDIGKIVTGHSDVFDKDPRGYALLLAAIVGAPFVIWRTWIAQRQAHTDEQGLITDRITKAVEQLGAEKIVWADGEQSSKPNLEVRLGGIYSLERIARDSLDDHITVMEILCAYIRNNSPADTAITLPEGAESGSEEWDEWLNKLRPIRFDLQAVIDVIGRRTKKQISSELAKKYKLDFYDCNLQRTNFSNGNFKKANFERSYIDFSKFASTRLDRAHFYWTDLNGSTLHDANLTNCVMHRATLINTHFDDAIMQNTFVAETNLKQAQNISASQLKAMFGDANTTLPEGVEKMPDGWPEAGTKFTELVRLWRKAV